MVVSVVISPFCALVKMSGFLYAKLRALADNPVVLLSTSSHKYQTTSFTHLVFLAICFHKFSTHLTTFLPRVVFQAISAHFASTCFPDCNHFPTGIMLPISTIASRLAEALGLFFAHSL
ncbi:MAG TPA: hypothetical protein PK075_01120 [Chitinophagales bacterium]|nr:hypothetical protein [Chitinophagales bacterium]